MRDLVAGDIVTARYMPHLGIGVVEGVVCDLLSVSFEADGGLYRDAFAAGELRLVDREPARAA